MLACAHITMSVLVIWRIGIWRTGSYGESTMANRHMAKRRCIWLNFHKLWLIYKELKYIPFLMGEKYITSASIWANRGYLANQYVVFSLCHEEAFQRFCHIRIVLLIPTSLVTLTSYHQVVFLADDNIVMCDVKMNWSNRKPNAC